MSWRLHIDCSCAALACVGLMLAAHAEEGGVYIGGQQFSIQQAFAEALAANPQKSDKPFWVLVAGPDMIQLTREGANNQTREWARQVGQRGGMVYVCRSDLARLGVPEEDLLEGVFVAPGFAGPSTAPSIDEDEPLPVSTTQTRRILRTCAEDAATPASAGRLQLR